MGEKEKNNEQIKIMIEEFIQDNNMEREEFSDLWDSFEPFSWCKWY